IQFRDIGTVDDIYAWLTDTLIPTVFVTTDQSGGLFPEGQRGRIGLFNQVLGGVLLKMKPRSFTDCPESKSYVDVYPNCTDFDGGAQVSSTYLPIGLTSSEASELVADLTTSGTWVNFDTLQLGVKVVTYNAEGDTGSGGFTVTKLDVSFAESGPEALELKASITSVPDFRGTRRWVTPDDSEMSSRRMKMNKTRQVLRLIGEFVLKFGALPAFATLWTVTISLDFDKKLLRLPEVYGKTLDQKESDTIAVIQALDQVEAWTNALSIVGAIAVLQLGLYTIRQLSFHPQLNVFARTVGNSLRQFRDFFLVFIIIFITFSFMGNLLFGDRVSEFSTAALSRESCMNMIFGTFEFSTIYNIRGSGWFYWGYMIIVSLILLNMMLAIVMGTYKGMSKDGYQGEINVMLASRI
ncbi:hypothetical protein PHYSODRAFT_456382, partial [Phytophthora sojae]